MINRNKKSILIFLIMIIAIFSIIYFGCSIYEFKDAVENMSDINVKWDNDIKIPLFSEVVDLQNNFGSITIGPFTESIGAITQWPVPPAFSPLTNDLSGDMLGSDLTVDFDSDGTSDFLIHGFRSTDASLVLKIWLENASSVKKAIQADDIIVNSIRLEGVDYNFSAPVSENDELVYTATNFLDPNEDYFFNFSGDAGADGTKINVESFGIELVPDATPDYSGEGPYTLNTKLIFTVNNYQSIGEVTNTSLLYNGSGIPVPLSTMPMESIKNFKFSFIFSSSLPLDLSMNINFSGDQTPDPSTFDLTIDCGELTQAVNSDWYVTSPKETISNLNFNGNVLDYGDINMNFTIQLVQSSKIIRLAGTDSLDLSVNAEGTATFTIQ